MHARLTWAAVAVVAAMTFSSRSDAQAKPDSQPSPPGPDVGAAAPDFSLPGATRYGLLQQPVRLSDYRGETVVLAFFYQARTKG